MHSMDRRCLIRANVDTLDLETLKAACRKWHGGKGCGWRPAAGLGSGINHFHQRPVRWLVALGIRDILHFDSIVVIRIWGETAQMTMPCSISTH